jgi:uncharacterized LabA/DUF88 family protein
MRLAAFIDGPHIYSMGRALGFDIDYRRVIAWLRENGTLIRATYYTTIPDGDEFISIKPLIDWLDYNGFTIRTKAVGCSDDPDTGRRRWSGNMHVEIALDAVTAARDWKLDQIIMVCGDSALTPVVREAQRFGVRVAVVGALTRVPTPMVADSLRRAADDFIDFSIVADSLRRATPRARIEEAA